MNYTFKRVGDFTSVLEGYATVATPCGAYIVCRVGGSAYEVCEDAALLQSGRPRAKRTSFDGWFDTERLENSPPGLVAELYFVTAQLIKFDALIVRNPDAFEHLVTLQHFQSRLSEFYGCADGAVLRARSLLSRRAADVALQELVS